MEAVLVGDLHLDKCTNIFGEKANELVMNEMSKVMEYALDNGIKQVIQLGDVGHKSRLSYSAQLALWGFLDKWKDSGIQVDFILGNHDHDELGVHSLEVLEKYAPRIYPFFRVHSRTPRKPVLVEGVECFFLSWPHVTAPAKRPAITFGHFEVRGSTADNGREITDGHDVDPDIFVFCGHLHTPHSVGRVHYVGTLYPTTFGESGKKSFTVLKARYNDSKIQVKTHRVEHESDIQLRNLVINRARDLEELIDRDGDPYRDDPLWKYRLVLKEGVEIPDDFLLTHENIIKVSGYKSKVDLESVLTEDWTIESSDGVQISPDDAMRELLTDKYKLTPARVKKAMKMLGRQQP